MLRAASWWNKSTVFRSTTPKSISCRSRWSTSCSPTSSSTSAPKDSKLNWPLSSKTCSSKSCCTSRKLHSWMQKLGSWREVCEQPVKRKGRFSCSGSHRWAVCKPKWQWALLLEFGSNKKRRTSWHSWTGKTSSWGRNSRSQTNWSFGWEKLSKKWGGWVRGRERVGRSLVCCSVNFKVPRTGCNKQNKHGPWLFSKKKSWPSNLQLPQPISNNAKTLYSKSKDTTQKKNRSLKPISPNFSNGPSERLPHSNNSIRPKCSNWWLSLKPTNSNIDQK